MGLHWKSEILWSDFDRIETMETKTKPSSPGTSKNKKEKKFIGFWLDLVLIALLVFMLACMAALFVTGPYKIHQEKEDQAYATMTELVPAIQGITKTDFDYITYQGYTVDTLYWFDVTGQIITTRDISTLDYNKAKDAALELCGVETDTIQLAYGYTAPVYEIQGSNRFVLLDYDTLELIYERGNGA